jgi:hypothetical protein
MPIVKTVSVTFERKFNLGDYNSANVGCTLWADVEEDENLDLVMYDLWAMAKDNVKAAAAPYIKNGANLNIQEAFLGLPSALQPTGDK